MDRNDNDFEAFLMQFQPRRPSSLREPAAVARRSTKWLVAAVAGVLLVLSLALFRLTPGGDTLAFVETADSSLSRISAGPAVLHVGDAIHIGDLIHANGGAGAVLRLRDDSRVEMRSKSDLQLENGKDGLLLQLNDGSIIVSATKQHAGHLYVRTKDVTVSVIGTVFLVNSEAVGSRVAVIQGEVRVQQGTTETKLLPGQQVATSSVLEPQPVSKEISWSRHAEEHLALLQEAKAETPEAAQRGAPATAKPLEFAAVSVRLDPYPPGIAYPSNALRGFVCRGTNGLSRMFYETRNGNDRLDAPLGRCVGNGFLLSQLIPFIYGVGGDTSVDGAPAWARARTAGGPMPLSFQIEAVAEDPASTTTDDLTQMMKTMLADRFKLKLHIETRDVPGTALVVLKDGPKNKLHRMDGAAIRLPMTGFNDKGERAIIGTSTIAQLAQFLTEMHRGFLPVVDKTGLDGVYDYEIVQRVGLRGGGDPSATPFSGPPSEDDLRAAMIDSFNQWLEPEVGLRQVLEKSIPSQVIVIDQVEKPTLNFESGTAVETGQGPTPHFEVATIKPNKSGMTPSAMGVAPSSGPMGCHGTDRGPQAIPLGRCMFTNVTTGFLISVISIADNKEYRVSGLPDWVTTEGFDIDAKADHPVTSGEMGQMLKSLLIDRFKCTFHAETREVPGFALVALPKVKVEKADSQNPLTPKETNTSITIADALTNRAIVPSKASPFRPLSLTSSKATMAKLANNLSAYWTGPIVDFTGLDGYYKLRLRWQPVANSTETIDRADPTLPTALQEQLGLKLESRKVPVEFLIVDHIDKPAFD